MKRTTRSNSSTQQSSSSRCIYMTSGGGRCRMPASPDSPYCRSHAKNAVIVASTLAAELSQAAGSLSAPEDVNHVLAKIFLALAADRLSTRKAAVLGYIGQMLLRSHREIAFHKKLADEEAAKNLSPRVIIDDLSEPLRDVNENATNKQIIVDIDGTIYGAPTPAVAVLSQGLASSANLECGPAAAAPLSQQPAPPTNHHSSPPAVTPPQTHAASTKPLAAPTPATAPSPNEPDSEVSPEKKPRVAKPSSDPSQPYPPLADLNHFYPRDPSLPPALQQSRNTTSPTDEEEQRWHELSRRYAPARRRT